MNSSNLKKDPFLIEWFATIEAAPNTQRNCLQSLQYYTEYTQKTPKELIEEAENEITSGTLMRKRNIKKYILGFREHLKNQNYAPRTVHGHVSAVRSFYRSFDIDLPQLNKRKTNRAQPTRENTLHLEKKQLQQILKHASLRNKAIILIGASSGLAQSDLLDLKISDIKNGHDPKTDITTLHIRRKKTQYDFITFLSPEASIAVIDYLEYRNRKPLAGSCKEAMIAWEKRRIHSDDDYLFCKTDIPDRYLQTYKEEDRRLNPSGLMDMFRKLAAHTGMSTKKNQWQFIRSHNLRKYFYNSLINNGADIFFAEFLMGHEIDSTKAAYFKADREKLKERYMRYVPYLALIDTETYVIETEEYSRLKEENRVLEARLDKMQRDMELVSQFMEVVKDHPVMSEILSQSSD